MVCSRRRLTVACASTVAAALLATGAVFPAPGFAADSAGSGKSDNATPLEAPSPAYGAFTDSGADGVKSIAQMEQWLGGANLRVGHTYLPGDSWAGIEGQVDFLKDWADWKKAEADRLFVLNVPMLADNEGNVPDDEVRYALMEGAAGRFDAHFRALARRLVALGVPDTVIVLGWEMNGTTYTGRCGPDPGAWKAYWNRIVTAMRSVPGQEFKFDFAPNRGTDDIPWTQCYPGDDSVDIIGMDSYDQPTGETFREEVTEPYGLQQHVDFAAAHHKFISYPEWGLFRNGDDPAYMRGMLAWIARHKPVYNSITDYCPHGVWQCAENPASSQVFQHVLNGIGSQPQPPTGPTAPGSHCTVLHLGSWLESWFGGPICVRLDWRHWLS